MGDYEKTSSVELTDKPSGLTTKGSTDSLASLEGGRPEGRDIEWSGVNFSAGEKAILTDCWGKVKSGETCAILGPSGSGKSSLLNVLAGRSTAVDGLEISHQITVGGKMIDPVSFRRNIAYVMQEDSLMATATPREALRFSAHLRSPQGTSEKEINDMVEQLLTLLGLEECADVLIGNAMIKGISGGQKKRTSVGVELITKPSLLFLDEPTSGLDSYNAYKLVELLKATANMNTAVLCTIHQPSSEVFFLFDQVIFLKAGRVFYQGPTSNLMPRFDKLGLPCPANYNPADHVMSTSQKLSVAECEERGIFMQNFSGDGDFAVNKVGDAEEFQPVQAAGPLTQLYYLFERELLNIVRDKGALIGRFGITIFLNLLFGLIWLGAGSQDDSQVINFNAHFGAITMVTISSMFGSAQPVMIGFPFERPMFMREYSTGTYYSWTYFVTKTLLDLPLTLMQTLVQWGLIYPLADLQGNFGYIILASWGLGCASASCGMALGCAVSDVKDVTEFAPLLFVPQLLFAGFFIQTSEIPVFLRWAQYLCGIKYALNIILSTEFNEDNDSCSGDAASLCSNMLEANEIEQDMMWFYILMLVVLFAAFRLIAMAILAQKSRRFY
jgi:ABC-type multidrug transport system ATPase subunit